MKKTVFLLLIAFAMLLLIVQPVQADGIIIPPPDPCPVEGCIYTRPMVQLDILYHHVTVEINQQLATTHVDQVFHNPNTYEVEGTYVFPIPLDAVVTNFILWIDGQPVEGKILSAEEARQTYEQIVNSMRDPALLEYMHRGALQASVYPIPPNADRRIELEYTQVLTADNGLVNYNYPLNTEKFSASPLQSVSVTVHVQSAEPLRAVYSPSHPINVNRASEYEFTASYESSNTTPDTDFSLIYSLGDQQAFHLFSYIDPTDSADPDGFFMLLLAPRPDSETPIIAKDVLLVLDHSGSMEGEKFQQAQSAARYILQHLNQQDRFYLLSFSSSMERFSTRLEPASRADQAVDWIDGNYAAGSTDINSALLEAAAVADRERPTYLIFLTDGLPTSGETDSEKILSNFTASAPSSLRLFAFGVGYDVDTYLLDSLSSSHHGLSTYVTPGQNLDEVLSSFYASINTPVLTNLKLDFDGLSTYDIYPNPLPDLFKGSQVIIVGRYHRGGTYDLTLTGLVNGEKQTFTFDNQVFASTGTPADSVGSSLPRLWATRKVGFLLERIRLQGPDQETVDQIVKLSIRYGIITPYTSYLVTEPMPLGAANQETLSQQAYDQYLALPTTVSGMDAVEKAAREGEMAQANAAPAVPSDLISTSGRSIRIVNARTFIYSDGVWMDTAYNPDSMTTTQIPFLSTQYFTLAASDPDLASALALGDRVIVVNQGTAYEITTSTTPTGVTPTQPALEPTMPSTVLPITPTPAPQPDKPSSAAPLCPAAFIPLAFVMLASRFFKKSGR